jgi:hypothetical protein
MSFSFPIWLFLLGAIAVGVIAYLVFLMEKRRRVAFQAMADHTGLRYAPDPNPELASHFEFLNALGNGSNHYARHVITGEVDGLEVVAFEYHYETYSSSENGRKTHHHYLSVFTTNLSKSFPELTIRPEGVFSKIAQAVGYDDIDFESAEFSRRYCVRSRDKKFAYDVCHPLTMEFLMRFHDLDIEIEGTTLAAIQRGHLQPNHVESNLRRLLAFRRLLPKYLLQS